MPNYIPATGEAMPKSETTGDELPVVRATDPLLKVINDHNKAWSEYCVVEFGAEGEAGLKEAWQKPYDVLRHWDEPCSSKDGAIAAMKLALDEIDAGEGPLAKPMLLAALGYLEGATA